MEDDLAVIPREGSKPKYAPSSNGTVSVKEGDHFCDSLRSQQHPWSASVTVSITSLQYHATQCSVCCLLSHAADANLAATHRQDAHILVKNGLKFAMFYVSGTNAENGSTFRSDPFILFTPSDSPFVEEFPFGTLYKVDPIPRDTSSKASFVWAERQIAKCNQDHNCLLSAQGSPLPSRVLDVSLRDAEKSIRLLTTTNPRERYICLSHCWGDGASVTKTTLENLKSHNTGIAISKLPKTFQDAVDITRRLGIDYLWIDSLCIIQNSDDDWKKEAARMADIYEGAYLTIAATASGNSSEGCYRSCPSSIREKGFSYTTKTGLTGTIYCRQFYRHFDLNKQVPSNHKKLDEFPLLDRGWVFQERFLSPRVLHFGNPELAFECRNGARCQCNYESSDYGFKKDLMHLFAQGPGLVSFQPDLGWWAVVSRYSRLKLTYDKDILTALSGISRRVGTSQPPGDYLAGIWKSVLPHGLLWYVRLMTEESPEELKLEFRQADAPRAPSWSWASVVGPIEWQLPEYWSKEKPLVEINDISCEVSEADVYGRVYGGILSITGPILTSNLCWKSHSATPCSYRVYDYEFRFSAITDEFGDYLYPDYPFFAYETGPWVVKCLWVMPTTILVLKPSEKLGFFERIGLLRLNNRTRDQVKTREAREGSIPTTVQII